jgi:hypothetical protein
MDFLMNREDLRKVSNPNLRHEIKGLSAAVVPLSGSPLFNRLRSFVRGEAGYDAATSFKQLPDDLKKELLESGLSLSSSGAIETGLAAPFRASDQPAAEAQAEKYPFLMSADGKAALDRSASEAAKNMDARFQRTGGCAFGRAPGASLG